MRHAAKLAWLRAPRANNEEAAASPPAMSRLASFRRKPESRGQARHWIPAFAGMTGVIAGGARVLALAVNWPLAGKAGRD
jgi:hypothetical protein